MMRLLCLLIGYAFGCFQSAYIVGRLLGKIDIREYGSGNAGATNVTRVMGGKAGLLVGLLDVLKAVAAHVLAALLFRDSDISGFAGLYAGLGAILGHNFPFYLKFKGGKGAACMLGVVLVFNWQLALIAFAVGMAAFLATKYISVGSLTVAAMFPILLALSRFSAETVSLGVFIAGLCYYQHRSNIQRLLSGTERKFSIKKKGAKTDE